MVAATLVVVAAACAWLLVGGGGDRRYAIRVADAGQLVKGDLVRLAGRTVGSVRAVRLAEDRRAEVVFAVDEDAGPLRRGTRVAVRAASLTGVANRYLALTPGPPAAPALPEGSTLPASAVTPLVELDEVVGAFDPLTREGLRGVVRGVARQIDGRGRQANAAAEHLDPALQAVRGLAEDLAADDATLRRFVASSARVVHALGSRRDALAGAVGETATALDAVAGADADLERALARAPRALRATTAGLAELRR
ncbi:MAG TPA: MlaD family protein, partial [Baekduia sp.]|nr:MlaD family protein [Baekduia sp.]